MKIDKAVELFFQVNKMFHSSLKNSECVPLSMPQMATMMYITHSKDVLLKDVAKFLKVTNASASALVQNLCEKGYVQKLENKKDRRATSIIVSDAGKAVLQEGKKCMSKVIRPFLSDLSDTELDSLVNIFQKLIENGSKLK
jgi:DNA-binding MarR family transcriptional regulator